MELDNTGIVIDKGKNGTVAVAWLLSQKVIEIEDTTLQKGEWVRVAPALLGPQDTYMLQERIPARFKTEVVNDRVEMEVIIVPLGYYLWPTYAKEKNFVLAYSSQVGNVVVAFENSLQHYVARLGSVRSIAVPTNQLEQAMQKRYSALWCLHKYRDEALSPAQAISTGLRPSIGLVVDVNRHRKLARVLIAGSEHDENGSNGVADLEECPISVRRGDRIKCFYIKTSEPFVRKLAIAPERADPPSETTLVEGHIEVMHDITVPKNPAHNGRYKVPNVGWVDDTTGVITPKLEGRRIRVRSRCTLSEDVVKWTILELIHKSEGLDTARSVPSNGQSPRAVASKEQRQPLPTSPSNNGFRQRQSIGPPSNTARDRQGVVHGSQNSPNASRSRFASSWSSSSSWSRPSPRRPHSSTEQRFDDGSLKTVRTQGVVVRNKADGSLVLWITTFMDDGTPYAILPANKRPSACNLGGWLEMEVTDRFTREGRRVLAAKPIEAQHETRIVKEGEIPTVEVRAVLHVVVRDEAPRLNSITLGYVDHAFADTPLEERKCLVAWCRKLCGPKGLYHWMCSPVPDIEWVDEKHVFGNKVVQLQSTSPAANALASDVYRFSTTRYRSDGTSLSDAASTRTGNSGFTNRAEPDLPPIDDEEYDDDDEEGESAVDSSYESGPAESPPARDVQATTRPPTPPPSFARSAATCLTSAGEDDALKFGIPLRCSSATKKVDVGASSSVAQGRAAQFRPSDSDKRHAGLIVSQSAEYLYAYCPDFGTREARISKRSHPRLKITDYVTFNARQGFHGELEAQDVKETTPVYNVRAVRNTVEVALKVFVPRDYNVTERYLNNEFFPDMFDVYNKIQTRHRGKTIPVVLLRGRFKQNVRSSTYTSWAIDRLPYDD